MSVKTYRNTKLDEWISGKNYSTNKFHRVDHCSTNIYPTTIIIKTS